MSHNSVIRSLRISPHVDEELKNIAKERGTSVNAIAEAELTKLVEFGRFTDEMEYAVVRKAWLAKLIGYLSEEEIREFGQWSGVGPSSESIRFYHGTISLESVLRTYEEIGAKYAKFYKFRHESSGSSHTIFLNHGLGMNWSIFYDATLKKVFRDILGLTIETELSDNILIGRFEVASGNLTSNRNGSGAVFGTDIVEDL